MKMKLFSIGNLTIFSAILVLTLLQQAIADEFKIDLDRDLLRGAGDEPFFSELAIGEEAYVLVNSLCVIDEKLMLVANNTIARKYDYGLNLLFKREVENSVTGSIVAGNNLENFNKQDWFAGFGSLYSCEQLALLVPYKPILYTVKSIDDLASMTSLLSKHFR